MKRVLTAVALVPVVLILVFKTSILLFAPAIGLVTVLALKEYLGIVEAAGIKPFRWPTYILGLLPVAAILSETAPFLFHYHPPITRLPDFPFEPNMLSIWSGVCAAAPLIYGPLLVFRKDMRGGLASVAASMFGLFYVALPLSLLIDLRAYPLKGFVIVFILFSVWAGDIAAYYVGKKFGKHKLAPVVSPNKSWEGAIASSLASLGVAVIVFKYQYDIGYFFSGPFGIFWGGYDVLLMPFPWTHVILLGLFTNVFAQLGDLFESALKRGAGVKDSGTLLPGHGGVLDRIDALLFAIPFVVCYAGLAEIVGNIFHR
jgi:phosphatidate cytidylyltransferase